MKMKITAAAAFVVLGASGAYANECGLNAAQLAAGWDCDEVSTVDTEVERVTLPVIPGVRPTSCQTTTTTTTTTSYIATNPGGQVVAAKSVEGSVETETTVVVTNGACGGGS